MQYLKNIIIALTILLGLITFAQSETSWIKKKDKTETVKKVEKEKTSSWIKKKEVKENKKKFNEKNKNISKDVKSWITKKSKDKYISFENLPLNSEFYFIAKNEDTGESIYGYINSKKDKFFEYSNFYKNSEGFGFINDGKTICKIGSEINAVVKNKIYGEVHVNCGKLRFNGDFAQSQGEGSGTLKSKKGEVIRFDLYKDLNQASISFAKQNKLIARAHASPNVSNKGLNLKPKGKYYALLIGNSNYINWESLKSPKNDVKEIGKVLESQYNFEVMTIIDGTEKDIMKGFKKLSKMTTPDDYVLVYYSGHGDNVTLGNISKSYWIPVDGSKESGLGDWISTDEISNYVLEQIPNHHIVVMSDSCYFAMTTKGNQDLNDKTNLSYEKLLKRRAMLVIQSGSNEPVEDSVDNKHSVFGKSFIRSLKDNNGVIRMRDIISEIELSHAGMRQQPIWDRLKGWGDTGGDFLFIAKK